MKGPIQSDRVRALADGVMKDLLRIRHHLHAHPELSFQEKATGAFIAGELRKLGIEVREGIAGTGVIGVLHGNGPGRVVALRADMDALPIREANACDHRSTNEGVMHACGHDVHMTCVLGAARILHTLRADWSGTVLLLFQPGEEKIPGGASLVLKENALRDPAPGAIIGQHCTPELPVGTIGFREGPFMASSDELYITVKGKGGHAAQPEKLVDPIAIMTQLLPRLKQEFAGRFATRLPDAPALLAFGRVEALGATNVVPNEVMIAGTLRAFDEPLRAEMHAWLPQRAQQICAEHGGACDFEVRKGYPVLVNDASLTARVREATTAYEGVRVVDMDRRMGSEDFAFYTHAMPGCFLRLGTGIPGQPMRGLHTPDFDIDESALAIGAGVMAWAAVEELAG